MKWLEKVWNHIYKVKNSTDRLIWRNLSFERIDSSQYNLRIHSLKNNYKLLFFESYHPEWKIYLEEGHGLSSKSMFDKTHKKLSNSMSLWTLDSETIKKYVKDNYSEELKSEWYPKTLINWKKDYKYYTENKDGTIDVNLTIYFKPQEYFNIWIIVSFVTTIILTLIFVFNYIFTLVIRKKQTT